MEKIPFNISARTVKLLGRENVSNADGAIIELVKNCYDAVSSISIIYFDNKDKNSSNHSIYIIDNGNGMNEETIKKHWMTIGTNNKEVDFIAEDGRIKSGAKGIGRLALDRLGNQAELITLPKYKTSGFKWKVKWSDFEEEEVSINNVFAELGTLEKVDYSALVYDIFSDVPQIVKVLDEHDFSNGTLIKVSDLRDNWEDFFIHRTFSNLSMIVPPNENAIFSIYLLSAEKPSEYGEVQSIVNDDYDYKLFAKLDKHRRKIDITISRNEFDLNLVDMDLFSLEEMKKTPFDIESLERGNFTISYELNELLPGYKEKTNKDLYNEIGPFEFTLYFLKRNFTKKDRKKFFYRNFSFAERGNWLDRYSGIKLYRDNFRIRPYGESGGSSYDWLMLGERAAKSPAAPSHQKGSWRVRPNQVSGSISISRLNNINFEDKSSREGLQENESFHIFKELILKIINVFENDRQHIMRAMDKLVKIKDNEENNKREANVIAQKIIDIDLKYGKNKIESLSFEKLESLIEPKKIHILAKSYLASIKENKDLISELQLLRAMASTGLTITTFAHELKNLSAQIVPRNNNLLKILDMLIDKENLISLPDYQNPYILVDDMRKQDERLKNWLELSLSAIRKDKRNRKKIDLYGVFEAIARIWGPVTRFQRVNLKVPESSGQKCIYRMFEIDIDSIFNNLISNSLSAFLRNDANNDRRITIGLAVDNSNIILSYEDSGPGLSSDITDPNKIFEPLYTTKRDVLGREIGTGLGMWIVKSTVEEYKGTIKIVRARPNFKIEMYFPLKKGEGITD